MKRATATAPSGSQTVTVILHRGFAESSIALLGSLVKFFATDPNVKPHVDGMNLLTTAIQSAVDKPKVEARFNLGIGFTSSTDFGTFEIGGTGEWLRKTMPHIGIAIAEILKGYEREAANIELAREEIANARAALAQGHGYEGQIVTLTVT